MEVPAGNDWWSCLSAELRVGRDRKIETVISPIMMVFLSHPFYSKSE